MLIRKAAVVGAGTMGAGIAAHLANAGVPCLLLDVVPSDLDPPEAGDPKARSRLAAQAVRRASREKPVAFLDPADADLVEPGNVEDHLDRLAECDWILEAVPEDPGLKRDLYRRIARHRRPGTILSSNTSGLSLSLLVEGLDPEVREHFLITHFFNPPRHMYLLELVRGPDTRPEVFETVRSFAEARLGKGVVECKDTPNFIANRIGVFAMISACHRMREAGLKVEEVDRVAGPPLGRPKTAVFRLHDLVGIDVALQVTENVKSLCPGDEMLAALEVPDFLRRMVREGKLGRKRGEGFYKRAGKEFLVLDLDSFEYRAAQERRFESVREARRAPDPTERIRRLVAGDDAAARYAWLDLSDVLVYAASRVPEVADDVVSVDRAVRWGFNWELGPFEIWDALGVRETAERLRGEGREVPPLVESLLEAGHDTFYGSTAAGRRTAFLPVTRRRDEVPARPGVLDLDDLRRAGPPLRSNAAASLWDLGEGVLCVEFHSKMNAISDDTLDLVLAGVDEVEKDGRAGLVIGNQAPNFSAGADLRALADAAKERRFDAIDAMIRRFHRVALRIRYAQRPVVAALRGLCLGGGCEIPLACDAVQAAAETYIGLVELGVGLIPAGGGTREMACRAAESLPRGAHAELFPFVRHAFENIVQAKVAQSGEDARGLGYLRRGDGLSMNRDRALADAKRRVLMLAGEGYRPPRPRRRIEVCGAPGIAELRVLLQQYREGGYISEYDDHLAQRLAHVICGGEIDAENTVTEEYLLDLEREVFVELCGQPKTVERIEHMLATGKPLRN